MLRTLRGLLAFVTTVGLCAAAGAAPVTYSVVAGSVTTVQMFSLSGSIQPCPIGGGTNCLSNAPLAIDFGSITIDQTGLTLGNATIGASGTGSLSLGGLFGYTSVDFTNTTFQTAGASALGGGGGSYTFNAPGSLTTDLVLNTLGGPVALPGTVFPGSPTGTINISGNQLFLNLQGVNLGMLCDPLDPANCAVVKADFQVRAVSPIPEPTAALGFGIGALILAAAGRRLRND